MIFPQTYIVSCFLLRRTAGKPPPFFCSPLDSFPCEASLLSSSSKRMGVPASFGWAEILVFTDQALFFEASRVHPVYSFVRNFFSPALLCARTPTILRLTEGVPTSHPIFLLLLLSVPPPFFHHFLSRAPPLTFPPDGSRGRRRDLPRAFCERLGRSNRLFLACPSSQSLSFFPQTCCRL